MTLAEEVELILLRWSQNPDPAPAAQIAYQLIFMLKARGVIING